LAVVKGRLTVALAAFLRISQAAIVAASGCLIPYPLIQTWRANTANSTSATSSQRKSSFRRMRLAAADAKVPYSAAAEMKGADQHGWLRPGFGHRVCGTVVAHGEA
jgi:hypothetical protein